jgi:hypothetical protein
MNLFDILIQWRFKHMKKAILILMAAVMVGTLYQGSLFAWNKWHNPVPSSCLPYPEYAKSAGTGDCVGGEEFQAMQRAGRNWSSVATSSWRFESGGLMSGGKANDGKNNLSFSTSGFQPGVLAVTYWLKYSGCMEFDVVFNDNLDWYCGPDKCPYSKSDLETVCLHEMGHVLGLDHSDNILAVMYAFYGGERRVLANDDKNGVSSLYPK